MKTLITKAMLVGTLATTLACSGQKFALDDENQNFGTKVEYNTEVDVLLVIDTSTSMERHQNALAAQMPRLVSSLEKTGLSYRIAVTTMDMGNGGARGQFVSGPASTPAVLTKGYPNLSIVLSNRIKLGQTGSSVERGLEAMKAAITAPLTGTTNSGFMRDESLLVVIFLSNEDDSSSSMNYGSFLDSVKPPLPSGERSWIANFIGVLPNDTSCQTAEWSYFAPGMRYKELSDASGGRAENVCTADLRSAVDNIRARIIEIVTEYPLGPRAADPATITVYINGNVLPEDASNGWTYNLDRNSITFHGSGVPQPGQSIHVDFTPKEIK